MSKKLILFFIGFTFFSGFHLARAEVVISEIAWMGSIINGSANVNAEWIELKNTGNADIDLSGWSLVSDDGTPNIILSDRCTNLTISADGFLLLERTSDDSVPGISADCIYAGAMGNTIELLKLIDNSAHIVSSVDAVYIVWPAGNNDTKETMQWDGSSWITAAPTPKAATVVAPPPASNSGGGSGDAAWTPAPSTTENKVAIEPKIKTKITAKNVAFVGVPLLLQANAVGYKGEQLTDGKYFWNFGDGSSEEVRASDLNYLKKFTHTYFYPGEYNVSLEYYLNNYGDIADAVDQVMIKVVPAEILISRVGDEKDFFVELSNNTNYDTDLSRWILLSNQKSFNLPKNTIIGAKKKITLSARITQLSVADQNTLRLVTPGGEMVFDYASSVVPIAIIPTKIINKTSSQAKVSMETPLGDETAKWINEPVSNPDLEVAPLGGQISVVTSDVVKNKSGNLYLPMILSTIFIGVAASTVYFIRQKKIPDEAGNDFKILDE